MAIKIKLTQADVDSFDFESVQKRFGTPGKIVDRFDIWDTVETGFGIRVNQKSKTYFLFWKIAGTQGKKTRVTIGDAARKDQVTIEDDGKRKAKKVGLSVDEARSKAALSKTELKKGVDVNKEDRREKATKIRRDAEAAAQAAKIRRETLQEVFNHYLEDNPKLKPHTIQVQKSLVKCHLGDWLNRLIRDITRDDVKKKLRTIEQDLAKAGKKGSEVARNTLRFFSRLYTHAIDEMGMDLPPNPVARVKKPKAVRRKSVLKEHDLVTWAAAVDSIDNIIAQDYLKFLILTGLRKNEALSLKWSDVDLVGLTFTVKETKNGDPHTLPITTQIKQILDNRDTLRFVKNPYIFPSPIEQKEDLEDPKKKIVPKHLVEPRNKVKEVTLRTQMILNEVKNKDTLDELIAKDPDNVKPEIKFCLHDLRRTFASITARYATEYEVKKLMNHRTSDVTEGYVIMSIEELRRPMQTVNNAIWSKMYPDTINNVVSMEEKRQELRGNGGAA